MRYLLYVFLLLAAESSLAKVNQRTLKLDCTGTGPSASIARAEALDECRKSAISFIQTSFKNKSLTVQTETDAALHEELKSNIEVQGLECSDPKEIIKESEDTIKISLTCIYALAKISIKELQEAPIPAQRRGEIDVRVNHSSSGKTFGASKRTLALTVIPQCSSILVMGTSSRIVRCKRNPTLVVITENDHSIIIRSDGYKPKELDKSEFGGKDEVQVILNP